MEEIKCKWRDGGPHKDSEIQEKCEHCSSLEQK